MADSVVISRLGLDVFKRHVYTEEQVHHDLSDLIYLERDSPIAWADRSEVGTRPLYCFFEYEICLDRKDGGPTIRFALSPSGLILNDEPNNGLVLAERGQNGFAMSIKEFERTALENGYRWGRSDQHRTLTWAECDNLNSLSTGGTYEFTIGRHIGEGFQAGVECSYLFDIIEGIRFDVFTGEILQQGIFQVPSGIACHGSQL
ncbi:MAG: hypothetical protein H6592_00090 [Flavobacteriales bacterium]|nr:hypothetical protein [Flavobacteriales bacterium]